MTKQFLKFVRPAGVILAASMLTACASSYPDVSNIQPVKDSALTPSELQDTIKELTIEKKRHKQVSTSAQTRTN